MVPEIRVQIPQADFNRGAESMRTKHAEQIRGGLHWGSNLAKQIEECPQLREFLLDCHEAWLTRAEVSDLCARAANRALKAGINER